MDHDVLCFLFALVLTQEHEGSSSGGGGSAGGNAAGSAALADRERAVIGSLLAALANELDPEHWDIDAEGVVQPVQRPGKRRVEAAAAAAAAAATLQDPAAGFGGGGAAAQLCNSSTTGESEC
jgi:hypothetical protein